VVSTSEEQELVTYLKVVMGRLLGLTSKEFRNLAFQLVEKNEKHILFTERKGKCVWIVFVAS
jgi:hypothetical protein